MAALAAFYLPTFRGGFSYWDDPETVLHNPGVRGLAEGPLTDRVTAGLSLFHPGQIRLGDYAPIAQLSLGLDLTLGAGSPVPFHVTQLLLHLAAFGLIVVVGQRLGAGLVAACLGALLFAVHPVQVEPIAWLSARGRMLASVFGLLALTSQLGARPRSGWGAFWLALGLLSKASALAYLAPMLLAGVALRRQIPTLAVALVAIGTALAIRLGPVGVQGVEFGRVVLVPDAVALYLHLLVVPQAASVFHGLDHVGQGLRWGLLPAALVVATLLALAPSRPRRVAGALLGACALLHLPNVVVLSGTSPVADRYWYDALAALGWLVATARVPRGELRWVGAIVCVVLGIVLSTANVDRQRLWASPPLLWSDAATKYPDAPMIWRELGLERAAAGDLEGALTAYRKHLELEPDSASALSNLALALARAGDAAAALPLLERAVELESDNGQLWFNHASTLRQLGRREEALAAFRRAVELQPDLAAAHNAIGVLLVRQRKAGEAKAAFEAAIELRPDRPRPHLNLAALLEREDHLGEAGRHYREAIRLNPGLKRPYNRLGLIYMRSGRLRQAITVFEQALQLDPGFEQARVNLGAAHLKMGLQEWTDVVRQNPGRRGLARQLERVEESGLLDSREDQDGRSEISEPAGPLD